MKTRPEDISPEMREFYKGLKGRPGMYIGSNDIHDLNVFMQGMNICVNKFFDEKVYEFDPIDNESMIKADSFVDFFKTGS